jgi:hypothetical protein
MFLSFLRQPLLHFFVIGAGLFTLYSFVDDTPAQTSNRPSIVVSIQDAQWLASQYESMRNRLPSEEELQVLVDAFVRQEIYVREALLLGLDQGDSVVRKRLSQKMEFLTEAGAEASLVDDAMLKVYFEENLERYRSVPRIAFSQILLPEPATGSISEILADLDAGEDFQMLGAKSLLPAFVSPITEQVVDGSFGQGVFQQIAKLEPGIWSGPVKSGFGNHLVRLDSLVPGIVPAFESLRDGIEQEWRRDKAVELRLERLEELRSQYDIETPNLSLALSQ